MVKPPNMNPEILKRIEAECEHVYPAPVKSDNTTYKSELALLQLKVIALANREGFLKGANLYAEKCEKLAEALREAEKEIRNYKAMCQHHGFEIGIQECEETLNSINEAIAEK